MRPLRVWLARLRGSVSSSRRERDLAAELESHLQLHIDDNQRAGMSPVEARRQALLKLGGVDQAKEIYRDRRGLPALARVAADVRFAARLFRRAPGLPLTVVATTMLAVGVNVAIFSMLNAAALRPLNVPDAGRLAEVTIRFEPRGERNVHGMASMLSYPEFQAVRDQARAFDGVAAFSPFNESTLGGAVPRRVLATLVSCEYFAVLHVRVALGRGLLPSDCVAGAPPVVVLSDALWHAAFVADPAIVGGSVTINRAPFLVVGVAPPSFTGTAVVPEDAFVAIAAQKTIVRRLDLLDAPNMSWLTVIGRLGDGASMRAVRADLDLIAGRMTAAAGSPPRRVVLSATPATLAGLPEVRTIVLAIGGILTLGVGLVLLIACANVANLLLARAAARRQEIAVRLAIGASRRRLVQQLLTESLLLAAIGGTGGVLLASWSTRLILHYLVAHLPPGAWPIVFEPVLDGRVLAYGLLLIVATGVAFGLMPALQTTRGASLELKRVASTDTRASRRLQGVLIVVQVAVCLVLLLSAGLLAGGLYRANTIDPGIAMHDVAVVSYDLSGAGYTPASAAAFQRNALDRLAALPGVKGVAETSVAPLSDSHSQTEFTPSGAPAPQLLEFAQVSAGYFDVLKVPIVRGRNFTAAEIEREGAAIVTESTARRLWPGQDPLAQSLVLDNVPRPIVGVVGDAQVSRLGQTARPFVFLPAGPASQMRLQLLLAGAALPDRRAIEAAVHGLDAGLAVDVARLEDNLENWRAPSRLVAALAAALAALALVLACTGVFGAVAYAVSRRTREIGIRVALGAGQRDVSRLIVRQGMTPVIVGLAIGLVAGLAISSLLTSMLFGLSPHDPAAVAGATAALFAVALLACALPARRALRVEPTSALRAE